jgi:hypothetical protein
MNDQSKKETASFAFKLSTIGVPWEHEERTVYTVEEMREEIKARLAPPVQKEKKTRNAPKARAAKA